MTNLNMTAILSTLMVCVTLLGSVLALRGSLFGGVVARMNLVEAQLAATKELLDECREDRHWLADTIQRLLVEVRLVTGHDIEVPPRPPYRRISPRT